MEVEQVEARVEARDWNESKNAEYWKVEAEKAGNELSTYGFHFITFCGAVTLSCAIAFQCVANFNSTNAEVICWFGGIFYLGQLIGSINCWWKGLQLNEYNFRAVCLLVPLYSYTAIMTVIDVKMCFDGTQYSSDDEFKDTECSSLSTGLLITMAIFGLMPMAFTIANDLIEGNDLTICIFLFLVIAVVSIMTYVVIAFFTLYPLVILMDFLSCRKYKLTEKYVVVPGVRSCVKALRKVFFVFKERSQTDKFIYDGLRQDSND
jgi:hypothetical protein